MTDILSSLYIHIYWYILSNTQAIFDTQVKKPWSWVKEKCVAFKKMCRYFCIQDGKQLQLDHSIHDVNNENANIKYMMSYMIT